MAKLSNYRRIVTNDYKAEDRDLVDRMALSINNGFDPLYFALNKRLTLSDNMLATVKDVEVKVDSNGTPLITTSFKLDADYQVAGCQVILAQNLVNSNVYPTGQPFISFTQNGSNVFINNITNLQANTRYLVRIVAYG